MWRHMFKYSEQNSYECIEAEGNYPHIMAHKIIPTAIVWKATEFNAWKLNGQPKSR